MHFCRRMGRPGTEALPLRLKKKLEIQFSFTELYAGYRGALLIREAIGHKNMATIMEWLY